MTKWFEVRREKKHLQAMVKHCLIIPNLNNPEVLKGWGYTFKMLKLTRIRRGDA